MKIAVCIKQVPDTTELKLDPVYNTLIREGVESILNPLDEFPLEAALRLREAAGGTVTALTMGPPQATAVLNKAIAMGVDDTIMVSDRAFAGADTWATSLTLAKALEAVGPFDLILCGKQAIDGDTAQVGPGIAAHLDIPQVTYVTGVHYKDGDIIVERLLDSGTATIRVPLPAMLTILKEANEPRLPNLAGRLRTFHTTPRTVGIADLDLTAAETGIDGSPTRVVRISVPQTDRGKKLINGSPPEAAEKLLQELSKRGLVPATGAGKCSSHSKECTRK